MKGKLIAIEGLDGVGKTTLADAIHEWLNDDLGIPAITTSALSEGCTPHARMISDILRHQGYPELDPWAEVMLVAAARVDNWVKVIQPALERGDWVITDRHQDSIYCYQQIVSESLIDKLLKLTGIAVEADITFFIDLDHDDPRIRRDTTDRLESKGKDWWARCARRFRERFDHQFRYNTIYNRFTLDGSDPIEKVVSNAKQMMISHLIPSKYNPIRR